MSLLNRLRNTFRRDALDRETDEEMRFHLEMRATEARSDAPDEAAARRAAVRRFGNVARHREQASEMNLLVSLETILQDLRYALRALRRSPAFTTVAVLSLALGIGVNTAFFTVFNAMALRPWSVRDPARVVSVLEHQPQTGESRAFSAPDFLHLREQGRSVATLVASRQERVLLRESGNGERARAEFVTGDYLPVLGGSAVVGRAFAADEDRRGTPHPVLMVSYPYWQRHWNGDPAVVGRQVTINRQTFTIIGVSSPDFAGTLPTFPDLWLPLSAHELLFPDQRILRERENCCLDVVGRLQPGVSREQALAALAGAHRGLDLEARRPGATLMLRPASFLAKPEMAQQILPVAALALAAIGLVLLIACANVANLLLARGAARHRELGVRLSLGASRARVVRQLLTESLVVALLAAVAGLWLAYTLPATLVAWLSDQPLAFHLRPDGTVLAYTLLLTLTATLAAGVMPALQVTRPSLVAAMHGTGHAWGERSTAGRLRSVLVAVQMALCLMLLVGAGLFLAGMRHAQRLEPGFNTSQVLAASLNLELESYDATRAASLHRSLVERLRDLPGVRAAALADVVPLGEQIQRASVGITGQDLSGKQPHAVLFSHVSPGYFDTLQVPFLQGRDFATQDQRAGAETAIINELMARRFWPNGRPLGHRFHSGSRQLEVVGVVRDFRSARLYEAEAQFFLPINAERQRGASLLVRTDGDLTNLEAALPRLVREQDAGLHVMVRRMRDLLDPWVAPTRAGAAITSGVGGLALALALVGLYGVVSFTVTQRTREWGIRSALGADRSTLLVLAVRQGLVPVLVGTGAGLLTAGLTSGVLRSLLFGVSPLDPVPFGGMTLLLLTVAAVASYLPARRAALVDPVVALRHE